MVGIGIDIGSTAAKAAVVETDNAIAWTCVMPTGYSSVDAAERLRGELAAAGYDVTGDDVRVIVTRPDDASIRASERMMTKAGIGMEERRLVVNRATAQRVRKKAQKNPAANPATVEMTLDCPLAGCIPEDDSIAACSQKGRIALECDGPARRALAQLTDALLDEAK